MISSTGTPVLTSVFASASAKMPHLLADLVEAHALRSACRPAARGATCSLRAVFSMKVPVPPLHADCMYTCLRLAVAAGGEEERLHVLAADLGHEVARRGAAARPQPTTATTSWTILAPTSGREHAAPEPVKKTRSRPAARPALVLHAAEELEHLLRLAWYWWRW
mgnify:CR=1 FL=1